MGRPREFEASLPCFLLRAGAAIPPNVAQPRVRKVAAAGGFAAYERAHRLRLATILARVAFPGLQLEMVACVRVEVRVSRGRPARDGLASSR